MENEVVLEDIRGFAAAGRIRVTRHGRQRMNERGVTFRDLRHALVNATACKALRNATARKALVNATACKAEDDERWKVYSTDLSGDPLEVILLFLDGLLVVTVY